MARKPLKNASDSAAIIDAIMRMNDVSLAEMARRAGVVRQTMIDSLGSNMGFNKFLKYLELLGYGLTIRPLDVGLGLVDMSDDSICSNCAYKKLGEAIEQIKFLENGGISVGDYQRDAHEETKIEGID